MTKEEIREELLAGVNAYRNGARDREYVENQINYYYTAYRYMNGQEIKDMLNEIDKEKQKVIPESTPVNNKTTNINSFRIQDGILSKYDGRDAIVQVPSNVREIADYAFSTNTSIKQILFQDNSLRKIGAGAFRNCSNLEGIELPNGTILISDDAFLGCKKMQHAIIPASVKYISADVFDKDSGITVVGEPGTEAESYAKRNSLTFQSIKDFNTAKKETKKEEKKKEERKRDKPHKSFGKSFFSSSETKQAMYYLFLFATIILTIMTAYYWIKTGTFNDAPYATGPYGSNVVHPVNPYRKYVFICGPLACLSCCFMTNAKE